MMKTIETKMFGTIYYGSLEEIYQKASDMCIGLSGKEENYFFDKDGRTIIFSISSGSKDNDLKKIEKDLLVRLLLEVNGENLLDEECMTLGKNYFESIQEIRKEFEK